MSWETAQNMCSFILTRIIDTIDYLKSITEVSMEFTRHMKNVIIPLEVYIL